MKITQEQINAIEYLEKYAKWETYGERSLEKDITTVLNLVEKLRKENKELKEKNGTLEELLQGTLYEMYKYYKELANTYQANCISKEKIKDKLKIREEELKESKDSIEANLILREIYILKELLESE